MIKTGLAVIGGVALFIGLFLFLVELHGLFERVEELEERMKRQEDAAKKEVSGDE